MNQFPLVISLILRDRSVDLETSDYKDLFLNEAREYISTLNNSLVELEKDPSHKEAIREIFRAAHTLKGMSATMGYEPMARLCHQMETVLDSVRSGNKPLTSRMVDALFVCLDQLENWVQILTQQDFIEEERLQKPFDEVADIGAALFRGITGILP